MSSFTMSDDLLLVVRTRQWLSQQGLEDHFADLIDVSIKQGRNPFSTLDGGMDAAIKLLAEHLPNRNGHSQVIKSINGVKVPANLSEPMAGLDSGDTIKPARSTYHVDLGRMVRVTGPNIVRAWAQDLETNTLVTGDDITKVLELNFRGFKLKSKLQKQAAADNIAYALRNSGILEWVKNGNSYRRSQFFKTEKVHRKGRRAMSTNNFIQIFLDGGSPNRRGQKLKVKAKA
jgi:hypothetical protein